MKNYYLIILNILLLSFSINAQNVQLPENHELIKFKKERINNISAKNETTSYYEKSSSSGFKSATDDFGNPPNWDWINTFGGSGIDIVREVTTSADGSLFITGSFSGEISIESSSYTSVGRRDAFLAKFQSDGTLVWFKQFSPLAGEKIDAYGIDLDDQENIYFTGYYTGDVSFGDFNLTAIHDMNMFLAIADPEGEITMATAHTTSNPLELGQKVDTDDDGNIYLLGSTDGSTSFRHPTVIVKYDSDGNVLLDYYNDQNFCDMKVVGDNIYFTGTINSPGYIGDFYFEPISYGDAFVAKSNINMEFEWAYMAGHSGSTGDSYGVSLYVSSDENIFITGNSRTDIIWESLSAYCMGGYIACCSSEGNFLWIGNDYDFYGDTPTDITGNNEKVFVSATNSKLNAFDISNGNLVTEMTLNSDVENICYNATDNSLIISQSADELIQLSKLDDNYLETMWSIPFGGNSAWAHSIGMDIDQFGYQFNFGYASNQMDYFGQTINKGLFLARQNAAGNPLWVVQFSDADDLSTWVGDYIVVDTVTNSVYITGMFYKPFEIPGGPTLTPDFWGSIFILKYDFNGNYQWAFQEDFRSDILSLTYDKQGHLFLSGTFSNTVNIGNTQLVSAGYDDVFIAKYNNDGQAIWAKRAGGEDSEWSGLLLTDGEDNIYLTGEFYSVDVTVGDYPITMADGDGNIILAKFDSQGNTQWVTTMGGSSVSSFADFYGWPTGIRTDTDGNCYIKGWCNDSAYFDNILLTSSFNLPSYNNRWNKFIAKYNTEGNAIWATSISELNGSADYNQFDVDENGNVYAGFRVRDTTLFGNDFMYTLTGKYDLLIVNYSNDGELNWVKSIEDSESGITWISSVAVYDEETAYVCGWFTDYLDFGTMSFEVDNKTGFIGLLGELTGIPVYERETEVLFDIYPNPANREVNISLIDESPDQANLLITDITGREVYSGMVSKHSSKSTIDITSFSSGVYFIKLNSGNEAGVKKLVVN